LSKVHDLILNRLGAVYGEGCSSLLCLTIFNLLSNLSKIFQLTRFVIRNIQVFILLIFLWQKRGLLHAQAFLPLTISTEQTYCSSADSLQQSWHSSNELTG